MDQVKAMRTFVRVIDEGSFVAASRALEIAPAVATRTIADLEAHLGARLMTRTTRRLALTDIGQRYLERARAILDDIDDATALVGTIHAEPRGLVRVVAPRAFAIQQLGPRLARFHVMRPQVTIELALRDRIEVPEEGSDISIVVTRHTLDGEFVARRLARSEVLVCAQPAFLDRAGRPRHPDDLANLPMLVPSGRQWRSLAFVHRQTAERVAINAGTPVLTTVAHALNLAGARSGLGVAALPSYLLESDLRGGQLEQVLPEWRLFDLTVSACMPSRKQVPASTRAFMDFLLAEFSGADRDPWRVTRSLPSEQRSGRSLIGLPGTLAVRPSRQDQREEGSVLRQG